MKRSLDITTANPTYETLAAQICHAENGRQMSLRDFQRTLGELQAGTNIRIYRLDQRDILRGRPAVLDVEVKSVDPQHSKFVCDGQYISSNAEEELLKITSAVCTVPITSDVIMLQGAGIGRHNMMLFKRYEEPVLIFIQGEEGSIAESGIKARVLGLLRRIGINID